MTRGIGAMMIGGAKGKRTRRKDDFYPTPWEGTAAFAIAERDRLAGARICEPCCGDGAMAKELIGRGLNVVAALDLVDRGYGVTGRNFLLSTVDDLGGADAIVTNPPFDQSAAFIRHALGTLQVPYLALLLKANYWHAANRTGLHTRYRPTATMPLTWRLDFTGEEASTMDTMWVVWDAQERGRERTVLLPRPKRAAAAVGDLFGAAA